MKLYVWRSSWNGMWYVSRDPKPETPYAAYMRRHHDKHFWTHRQAFADAWARTHPKEDAMSTPDLTITTIPDADALRAYLDAVGTPSPSLHPRVNGEDGYGPNSRWNGWNYTEASGVDAEGRPFQPMLHHYAHPNSGIACSSGQGSLLSHDHRRAWERVAFPVYLLPAKANVLHPEYTPDWS